MESIHGPPQEAGERALLPVPRIVDSFGRFLFEVLERQILDAATIRSTLGL